jgi:hypothetical protein
MGRLSRPPAPVRRHQLQLTLEWRKLIEELGQDTPFAMSQRQSAQDGTSALCAVEEMLHSPVRCLFKVLLLAMIAKAFYDPAATEAP